MSTDPRRSMTRKIRLAQLVLAAERLLALGFPLLMVVSVLLLALASGVLLLLPGALRGAVLAAGVMALVASFGAVLRWRWPGEAEAAARIDQSSGLTHRPMRGLRDRLAGPAPQGAQHVLWAEHQRRLVAQITALRVGRLRSPFARLDPYALRNGLWVALVAALLLNGSSLPQLTRAAFTPPGEDAAAAAQAQGLDVWITPPAYTGRAPVALTAAGAPAELNVPQGSRVVVRVSGEGARADYVPDAGARVDIPLRASAAGAAEGRASLPASSGMLTVAQGAGSVRRWAITVTPDLPPQIAITGEPAQNGRGALVLVWKASDDYGVAKLGGEVALDDLSAANAGLFAAPDLSVTLTRANAREAEGKAVSDLTAHPWAGLGVTVKLTARDQAGQTGASAPMTLVLPERGFTKELAQYLVMARKRLIRAADAAPAVVASLDRVLALPEGLVPDSGVYLAMQALKLGLQRDAGPDGLRAAVDGLWRIAIEVEDGALDDLRRAVAAARKDLADALAEGRASDEIAKKVEALHQAMAALLKQMQAQGEKAPRRAPSQQDPSQAISPQDLSRLLDEVQRLAQQGEKEKAAELLAALDDILKNLQAGGGETGQQGAAGQALNQLSDLLRRQQQLLDKTFRQGQDPGAAPGLQGEQGAIGKALQQLLDGLAGQGMVPPAALGEAGKRMSRSGEALGQGEAGRSLSEQGEAMKKLREGAQALAQQMGDSGQRGAARDPLGRPRASEGPEFGADENIVPREADAARAQRILESLRKRANDPGLGASDRSYLDRLLRDFY